MVPGSHELYDSQMRQALSQTPNTRSMTNFGVGGGTANLVQDGYTFDGGGGLGFLKSVNGFDGKRATYGFDMGKIADFAGIGFTGLNTFLNWKQLKLMQDQFKFQRDFDTTQLYNSSLAANYEKDKAVTGERNRDAKGGVTNPYSNSYNDSQFVNLGLPASATSATPSNSTIKNNQPNAARLRALG